MPVTLKLHFGTLPKSVFVTRKKAESAEALGRQHCMRFVTLLQAEYGQTLAKGFDY